MYVCKLLRKHHSAMPRVCKCYYDFFILPHTTHTRTLSAAKCVTIKIYSNRAVNCFC